MTDYHPLIARAVEGLEKNTGEARRALYERARTALVSQLRAIEPALSESEITRERLSLEDAIRKVEAEAARKSRTEPRPSPPPLPRRDRFSPVANGRRAEARPTEQAPPQPSPPPRDVEAPRRAPPPTARERVAAAPSPSLAQQGIKGFRDVVSEVHDLGAVTAKAVQSARDTRDSYSSMPPQSLSRGEESLHGVEPHFDAEEFSAEHEAAPLRHGGEFYESSGEAAPQPSGQHAPHAEQEHQRPPRSYRGLIKLIVAMIILAGIGVTISWQWPHITGLYRTIAQIGSKQPSQPARETAAQPKFSGRVPQEQSGTQPSGTAAPGSQTAPAVAQRVVLYEEDPNDPNGKRFVGSAIWRTETVSPGSGLAPELAVRADVEIPERHMTMTWSLRRNTDKALPASHTIEIQFTLPPDFPGGGIANVPGVLMKQSEQARGTPLAGLAVKVTNGFFLIGLSATDTDVQRNVDLLKDRPWFDIPIVYANGGRAILAMEKGPPGDRVFAEAFATWEKK